MTAAPKLRRDVWDTMSLAERAIRKAEKRVEEQIAHDAGRHGGVLSLKEALALLVRAHKLVSDHEDMAWG